MENINLKVCCRNLMEAVKAKILIINDGVFCLGNTEYLLKKPTKDYDTAVVKIFFCPWCGKNLSIFTVEIKQKIKDKEDKNEDQRTRR